MLWKIFIVVYDFFGFVLLRFGVLFGLEVIWMFEEGVVDVVDIDVVMILGYWYLIGLLCIIDLVGFDVWLGIVEELVVVLGLCFELFVLLWVMVVDGWFGCKSGEGFY